MPSPKPKYYISAYALACKQGFSGTLTEWLASLKGDKGEGIPKGGTTGQILKKKSDTDYDFEWGGTIDPDAAVPAGGTTGQILKKASDTDYDYEWGNEEQGGTVTEVDGISPVSGDVPLTIIGQTAPTTSTAGYVKQRYFDETTNKLYICTAVNGGTYTWTEISAGASITVDDTLSSSSENPVQNKVINAALDNKQAKLKTDTATVLTTDWDSQTYTATVAMADVTATNTVDVRYAPASHDDWINNGIYCLSQAAGSITLKAAIIPSGSIDIIAKIWD